MAYSKKIEAFLQFKKINIGDEIKIEKPGKAYQGALMPRHESGDNNCLIIKLENGYNIGIEFDAKTGIEKISKKQIEEKIEEANFDKLKTNPKNPSISILSCGGTIVSRVEYKTGAVFPAFQKSEILKSFPKLNEFANIKPKKLFDLLSEDINPNHWEIIAKEAAEEIRSGADGIVLMHGTDTMHYTSAALSFMLQDLPIPVVLVGAQRSSDRGSSDNYQNLLCASRAAISDISEVSVCMHGSLNDDYCLLHQGVNVRKMHTSRRDAFRSINTLPFAKIWEDGRIEYIRNDFKKRDKRSLKLDSRVNPNVCLIQLHPGIKSGFIESLSKFYDGVVLSLTGIGNAPTNPFEDKTAKSILPGIKSLIASGIPVVAAPQTIYGRLQMNVYTAGRLLEEAGVIGNQCDWTPETALVKLMWVLGHEKNPEKIKKEMLTNIAGEIKERSLPETFLY